MFGTKYVNGKLERDKHVIESVVRAYGPITRAGIHDVTKIRRSTTSQLVKELLEEGRVLGAERVPSRRVVGRKQDTLRFNEQYRFIAGIEFDEETVVASILDLTPSIKWTITEPAEMSRGVRGLVDQLVSCVRKVLKKAGLTNKSLLGVGIADPGLVDSRRGVAVMSSTIEFWREVPLREIFEKEFGVPAVVESKTRAKTVAERALGAGRMLDSLIYIDYGAGIGAGIVLDGKLLYGDRCSAGELGHTHVMEDGPACKCGSFGCLEAVAGARAVEARVAKAVAESGSTPVLAERGSEKIDVWTVFKAAKLEDKICSNIVADVGHFLGIGLANLVNLFNPSMVVFDRRLELAGQPLLDQVVRIVKRQALTYSSEQAEFCFGKLGGEAGVLGVALIALDRHFEIPMLKPPHFLVEPGRKVAGLRGES